MDITNKTSKQENVGQPNILGTLLREHPLMPSDIKVVRARRALGWREHWMLTALT